jgi:small subunit ribosomal protein S1
MANDVQEPANEEPNEETEMNSESETADQNQSDHDLFMAALQGDMSGSSTADDYLPTQIRRGQIITGTVASKSDTEILVDIGIKSEGIVSGRELDDLEADFKKSLHIGDEIQVYVLSGENTGGYVELSLRRAFESQDWTEAEKYQTSGMTYETTISGLNKGGLIAMFGKLRGFIPASQMSRERQSQSVGTTPEERWSKSVGDAVSVKVIEVDRRQRRLILSEQAAMREVREKRRKELIGTIAVGQRITGQVISLTDFGAFVELGGIDGLVHLSELSWEHVKHPRDILKVGDKIDVEVININLENQRVGLSRKRCLTDPWVEIASNLTVGQLVQGRITKITKFGAFARLIDTPEIEGLVHVSELSNQRVTDPNEVVQEDQTLTLRIIKIDTQNRRLGLSLKQVTSEEFLETDWQQALSDANDVIPDSSTPDADEASDSTSTADEAPDSPSEE